MALIHYNPTNVEFVSYTGKWPNLCSGILTLKIYGKEHRFGYGSGMYEPFWSSGAAVAFRMGMVVSLMFQKGRGL